MKDETKSCSLKPIKRRLSITQWVRNAPKILYCPKHTNLRTHCWEKTVCLMTTYGSEDHRTSPEGLLGYRVPPPSPLNFTFTIM